MARFELGQSGNPNGRPPVERSLAKALREIGEQQAKNKAGISNRDLMAVLLWEGITTGKIKFPGNGKALYLDGKAYVALVGKVLDHVDGPPKLNLSLSGPDDGPIRIQRADELSDDELAAIALRANNAATSGDGASETA